MASAQTLHTVDVLYSNASSDVRYQIFYIFPITIIAYLFYHDICSTIRILTM